jgi:hypothetical protein
MLKIKFIILLILLLTLVLYGLAFAFTPDYNNYLQQAAGQAGANYPQTQANETFINTFIGQIVAALVSLIGLIFLGLTVYSGIQWLTSGGNEEKISKAKTKLINGSIGVGLTLCAFIVANLVFNFLNQQFLTQPPAGPTPPAGLQNIPCTIDAQCEDQQFQIYCLNGQCVECRTSADCMTTGRASLGYLWCDPQWHVCNTAPAPGGDCPTFTNADDCAYYGCWWETGQCINSPYGPVYGFDSCSQITSNGLCSMDGHCQWLNNQCQPSATCSNRYSNDCSLLPFTGICPANHICTQNGQSGCFCQSNCIGCSCYTNPGDCNADPNCQWSGNVCMEIIP